MIIKLKKIFDRSISRRDEGWENGCEKREIENLKRACREKTSSKRRRRRRMSITAGGESEANATCGFTVCKWSVLEEGEHEQAVRRCHACL